MRNIEEFVIERSFGWCGLFSPRNVVYYLEFFLGVRL